MYAYYGNADPFLTLHLLSLYQGSMYGYLVRGFRLFVGAGVGGRNSHTYLRARTCIHAEMIWSCSFSCSGSVGKGVKKKKSTRWMQVEVEVEDGRCKGGASVGRRRDCARTPMHVRMYVV